MEIKTKVGKPMRVVKELLYDLQRIDYLAELTYDEKGDISHFLPAQDTENMSKRDMTARLAKLCPVKNS
jgi:hypothetical protein